LVDPAGASKHPLKARLRRWYLKRLAVLKVWLVTLQARYWYSVSWRWRSLGRRRRANARLIVCSSCDFRDNSQCSILKAPLKKLALIKRAECPIGAWKS